MNVVHDIGSRERRSRPVDELHHLPHHQSDGGEWRAEFVSRRGRKTVELRQVLFACQHEFRSRQRVRQQPGLLGHTRFVDADEPDPKNDRAPGPDAEQEGKPHRLARMPREGQMPEHEQGRGDDRETAQKHGAGGRHRGRRDHDRRQQQHGKRVFETSGQEQQRRELDEVIAEEQRRGLVVETVAQGVAKSHADVHGDRERDDEETPAGREREPQNQSREQDRHGLSGQGEPA